MKKSYFTMKAASLAMSAAMALSLCPTTALAAGTESDDVQYVLMNIPYADFYEAEVTNDVAVDGITSATKAKTRTGSLVAGSYHNNSDGSDISGITFPVKVTEGVDLSEYKQVKDSDEVEITVTNRGQTSTTKYVGKDALFENPDYSYYVLNTTPEYYKEVTVKDGKLSFGEYVGSESNYYFATTDLTTESSYGDYQLDVGSISSKITSDTTVYGVVLETSEGDSFGLRHLENIWRQTSLAWCTGFTSAVHGSPTSSDHYKEIMGEHIKNIAFYTSKGIINVSPSNSIYVPVKTNAAVSAADADVSSGQTEVSFTDLPSMYKAKYAVEGLEGVSVKNGVLSYDAEKAASGKYTLTVTDARGVYAPLTTTFSLYKGTTPVEYNGDNSAPAIVAKADAEEGALEEYISKISSVTVDGTSYAATGRGAVVIVKEDGTIDTTTKPFASGDSFDVTVSATGYKDVSFTYVTKDASESTYVLMNIPYDKFYANEVENSVAVDGFTSATKAKTRTSSLVAGSYHTKSDGSEISGVIYPVKVSQGVNLSAYKEVKDSDSFDITVTNRGQTSTTTYTGKETLFENADYAYYVLSERPAYYKTVSLENGQLVFGKSTGKVSTVSGAEAELSTNTTYGDYQLNISGVSFDKTSVNAVVLKTEEGASYGLRHLENIWRQTSLAWCTGFTSDVHGCPTSSDHYKAIMGQTITEVVYYTTDGMYSIPVNVKVPVKFEGSVTVENQAASAGQTTVKVEGLPADFNPEYTVDGLRDVSVDGSVLTYADSASKGKYTLVVSDKNNKYASLSADFELFTGSMPAAYDEDKVTLKIAKGASASEYADFIENITTVYVNDKAYAASGRGAVTIINKDGSINTEAAPIAKEGSYEIKVVSLGYQSLDFTYKLDHQWSEEKTEPATISADGKIYKTCSLCGEEEVVKVIPSAVVSLSKTQFAFNGKEQKPSVIVKDRTGSTISSDNYTVTYVGDTTGAGKVKVKVKFQNLYTGYTVKAYNIVAKVGKVSLAKDRVIYNAKVQKPSVVVRDSNGTVINPAYYSVSYIGNLKTVGTHKVVVTFKAPYSGTKRLNYKISPQSVILKSVSASTRQLLVKWTPKTAQITGYQIQFSTNKKFTEGSATKTVMVTKNTLSQRVISGLTKGKKYYVRIRSYHTVNDVKYFSDWSDIISNTVK